MRLTGLAALHRSMREQGMGRVKFRYRLNHLTFECLFFVDTQPFELVMGCLGHNFAIFKQVLPGFEINPFLGDLYGPLRDALFQDAGTNIKLDPSTFFAEFNRHIPDHASPDQRPTPRDIGQYYPSLEQADRLYFCGWLDNTKQGNQVTSANLDKTHRLMGRRAHDFSKQRNQSTRWTNDPNKAVALAIPD